MLGENGASPVRTRIEAVVDTGFTGYLTLPNDTAASLDLAPRGSRDCSGPGGNPRCMALLSGSEPRIRAESGGEVLFKELP